jgi:hypothetical protein
VTVVVVSVGEGFG